MAIGFEWFGGELIGVDPEPAIIEGRFESLVEGMGVFDAVTIGRAILWLDPEPALKTLDRVVAARRIILVCNAACVADGERPGHDEGAFFAGGQFVARETISVEATYAVPVERLADRVLSISTSSPERLGDQVPEMRRAMYDALAPFAADGVIEKTVEARAGVFTRAQ